MYAGCSCVSIWHERIKKNKPNDDYSVPLIVGIVLTIAFLLFCLYLALQENCQTIATVYICQNNLSWFLESPPNEMGDTFAGLAGALAFLWIIITVLMQKHELQLQREELIKTNETANAQNQYISDQNTQLEKQAFEATFFHLLELLTTGVSQIDMQRQGKTDTIITSGKDVFPVFLRWFRDQYNEQPFKLSGVPEFETAYEEFWHQHGSELGHYFRTIYNIVKFVANSNIEDKKFYTNILRAQLSDPETSLLFYNCLSSNGVKKFKPLVEEYALLKNVDLECLNNESLKKQYEVSAFGFRK